MHSKTSKKPTSQRSLWKHARDYTEKDLEQLAKEWSNELRSGDRVLLEGSLGAGKSTLARALIRSLGVEQESEGSPTFALAHEYTSPTHGEIVHLDLYRLRDESELEDAGIFAYFWERSLIALVEWTSLWPEFESSLLNVRPGSRTWRVTLQFADELDRREIMIEKFEPAI